MSPYSRVVERRSAPRIARKGSHFVVYYLGENPDDVIVREETELDFRELKVRLDSGSSVFVTMKPDRRLNSDEACEWC